MINFRTIKKIIVHDGRFHADEVCAIALIFFKLLSRHSKADPDDHRWVPIERKRVITQEEMDDPTILVIDVCGVYDPERLLFDHHHDASLPASNILIADWLVANGEMSEFERKSLNGFLKNISDTDRGIIASGGPPASFNAIIRSMNRIEPGSPEKEFARFEDAIRLAVQILGYQFEIAESAANSEKRWNRLKKFLKGQIAVKTVDDGSILGWHEFARKDGVLFLVTINKEGKWIVLSRDANVIQVPPDHPGQLMRHKSGHMAIYHSRKTATDQLRSVLRKYHTKLKKEKTAKQLTENSSNSDAEN